MMTPDGPSQYCLFYKFSNIYVQETAYDVWLEDQKKGLHEKAAMFLESQAHKCRACGGGGFVPGMDATKEVSKLAKNGTRSEWAFVKQKHYLLLVLLATAILGIAYNIKIITILKHYPYFVYNHRLPISHGFIITIIV